MKNFCLSLLLVLSYSSHAICQHNNDSFKELNFSVEGKKLEYLSFGGTGETLIWVMDLHNYFSGSEEGKIWIEHLSSLTTHFQVFVLIRPGYSKEQFDGSVFQVSQQAQYLHEFIKHLGNKKVYLYSKFPGNQDLIFLAENHPEILKGIIFQGSHLLYPNNESMVVKEFLHHFYAGACDLDGNTYAIVDPRINFRPDFIENDISIQIPLLILRLPGFDGRSLFLNYLDNIQGVSQYHFCGNKEAQEYFIGLAESPEDLQLTRQHIEDADLTSLCMDKLKRTFGDYLKVNDLDLTKDIFTQADSLILHFKKTLD